MIIQKNAPCRIDTDNQKFQICHAWDYFEQFNMITYL